MERIHLDTDLGGDTDDLCALAMLLKWPSVQITGITTNTEDGIPRQTAKLTPEGLEAIRMEKIYRSPVKRVLYMVYNAVFG